ncbi:MAG: LytTR family DNA-binding domain-containing protein [Bacteroidota bacterium]
MKNAIIIDDEFGARNTLSGLLQLNCPEINLMGEADSVPSGIHLLEKVKPDLLFLDIRIHDQTGFDLLAHFPQPTFQIIFTTAYDQFALQAFRYHAVAYLVKPILPSELIAAVDQVKTSAHSLEHSLQALHHFLNDLQAKRFDRITLSTNEGLWVLSLDDIIRLESDGNYTIFHTLHQDKILIAKTIKEYEKILPADTFIRIHRSHIININCIKAILKEEGGYLLSTDNARLPIARRKRELLLEFLKKNSL